VILQVDTAYLIRADGGQTIGQPDATHETWKTKLTSPVLTVCVLNQHAEENAERAHHPAFLVLMTGREIVSRVGSMWETAKTKNTTQYN
jgi:hypothetical protein